MSKNGAAVLWKVSIKYQEKYNLAVFPLFFCTWIHSKNTNFWKKFSLFFCLTPGIEPRTLADYWRARMMSRQATAVTGPVSRTAVFSGKGGVALGRAGHVRALPRQSDHVFRPKNCWLWQCCVSGSARIRIKKGLPDPHGQMLIRIRTILEGLKCCIN